jgi:hypothetical protein
LNDRKGLWVKCIHGLLLRHAQGRGAGAGFLLADNPIAIGVKLLERF